MAVPELIGRSAPPGASIVDGGVNFSLFSRNATGVELVLFDREDDAKPSRVIALDPVANRTYHYWHVFVPGVRPGQIYGYRVSGPCEPTAGLRFDPAKILLDPYGREVVVPASYSREAASGNGRQCRGGDEERGGEPGFLRLGRGHAAAPAIFAHDHLRDARARVHAPPELGCGRARSRDVCRPDRQDPLPALLGRHGG